MEFILTLVRSVEGRYFFAILLLIFIVCLFALGYVFGEINSIRDDLKSLDYDRLVVENEELKRAIEIKKKSRNKYKRK